MKTETSGADPTPQAEKNLPNLVNRLGCEEQKLTGIPPAIRDCVEIADDDTSVRLPAPQGREKGIPQALKNQKQWLCWKRGERDGKTTKIPVNPNTNTKTSAPDAAWSFEDCMIAVSKYGLAGVGFSLKNGFAGIDYDHVLDSEGNLKPEYAGLMEEIRALNSYTEISPSGEGLHVFVRCEGIPQECKAGKHTERGEMYSSGRFFTVTGRKWKNSPASDINTISAELYQQVYNRIAGTQTAAVSPRGARNERDPIPCGTTSEAVKNTVKEAFFDKYGEKAEMLFNGGFEGYASPSQAEQALVDMLYSVTDGNAAVVKDVFFDSEHGKRKKIQERPDYLVDRMIHNAAEPAVAAPVPVEETPQEDGGMYTPEVMISYHTKNPGSGWEADAAVEAALCIATISGGEPPDIADCGMHQCACRDQSTGLWTILSGPDDPTFKRFCGRIRMASIKPDGKLSHIGRNERFRKAIWDEIVVYQQNIHIHQMDGGAPITAIPTLDGWISLETGAPISAPPKYEYCPFRLHLKTSDAALNQEFVPRGRGLEDLHRYIGRDTMRYIISVVAASIRRIPANRRVTILTGPPRSAKTTFGKILGLMGLAPPPEVDFGCEVDGKGRFRTNLSEHIAKFPVLFVNDPADPDGNIVKRFCDTTQLYESKYSAPRPVFQRASVVMTVNDIPTFETSGMNAKIRFCHSAASFLNAEIPEAEYIAAITADGSIATIWQLILREIVNGGGIIKIPDSIREFDREIQARENALNKWLELCRPAPGGAGIGIHDAYIDYMVFANPDSDRQAVVEACNLHAKQARWKPKGGIAGVSKHKMVDAMMAHGIPRSKNERVVYVALPGRQFTLCKSTGGTAEKAWHDLTTSKP